MRALTKGELLDRIDAERVTETIERVEETTSGEICVSVAPLFWGNVEREARRAFARIGVDRTRERNGVLFFVVPSRRRLVILGDVGIDNKVGGELWTRVAARVCDAFAQGAFTEGLIAGIEEIGEELARHFPRREDDVDELSNQVYVPS